MESEEDSLKLITDARQMAVSGGGKKFVVEIFSAGDGEEEETGEVPVSRRGNWIRTVSCGFTLDSGGFVTGGCGNWMRTVSFFGWSGSAI